MAFIYNGEIFEKELNLSPQHRAIRYGDGVFETIKVIDGNLMYAPLHQERLFKGMEVLGIDKSKFSWDKIENQSRRLMQVEERKDGIIRINVLRKGMVKPKIHYHFDIIIEFLKDETAGKYLLNKSGLQIGFFDEYFIQPDKLSNIKSNNRTLYSIAQQQMPLNFDDVLLFNNRGQIADATIYNVFWIKDGKVFTNPKEDGGVDGVMRKVIIENLKGTEHEVVISSIDKSGILEADEIFLTNVVKGMRWVREVEGKEYSQKITKSIFEKVFYRLSE